MNPIAQAILDVLNQLAQGFLQGAGNPIQQLVQLIGVTPLQFTTANPVVMGVWTTMTAVADALLGLFVVIAMIQMMYGQATGTMYLPIGQFLSRVVLTVILMHLSVIIGQDLLILNNELCGILHVDVQGFIATMNQGQQLGGAQQGQASLILGIIASLSLLRVIFQAIKRLVFFDLLFVLSAPMFLLAVHPATAPAFSFWARTYVVTIFTQFLQFLAFGLGIEFVLTAHQNGIVGFVLEIAMFNLVAEIPALLTRFSVSAGASAAGVGALVRTALTASMLFL